MAIRKLKPVTPTQRFRTVADFSEITSTEPEKSLLEPLAKACGNDVERFASELALGAQVDSWDRRADRLSLLTLHAAKGLEFPVVFIVGCEDGLLPLRFGGVAACDLEEERRLLYVGMTRARERLLLCHAGRRRWRGKVRPAQPSPFLRDIAEQLLRRSVTRASYLSQSSRVLHFGLADAEGADSVEVRWHGGKATVLRDLPVDQVIHVVEPVPIALGK